jgi:tRNA(adenine34) deaminase
MEAALRLALAAAVREEVPVGAVVIREGTHLAEASNETVKRRDPTAHAELLAIQRALEKTGEDRLIDATLYVTLEPCAQCAGAIILAKVSRVVFGAYDGRAGMAGSIFDILRHPALNHGVEVIGGLMAEECGELLRRFFQAKREV